MKLTVLGGGGVRSAFLAKSLAYNSPHWFNRSRFSR